MIMSLEFCPWGYTDSRGALGLLSVASRGGLLSLIVLGGSQEIDAFQSVRSLASIPSKVLVFLDLMRSLRRPIVVDASASTKNASDDDMPLTIHHTCHGSTVIKAEPQSATGDFDELSFILTVAKMKSWLLRSREWLRGRGRLWVVVSRLKELYYRTDNVDGSTVRMGEP
jgi:hypothetical protein